MTLGNRRTGGRRRPTRPLTIPPTSSDPIIDDARSDRAFTKIKMFAKIEDQPELDQAYDSFIGCGGMDVLLGTNLVERTRIRDDLKRTLRRLAMSDGIEIALQLEPFPMASGSAPVIELGRLKAKARVFAKTGIASISAILPMGYPNLNDPLRFGIVPVAMTLFYGTGVRNTLEQARARSRSAPLDSALPRPKFDWLPAGKKAPLANAIEGLFMPRCYSWPEAAEAATALGIEDWTKASFAKKRAFQLFQVQSMMPLERLYFASNDGEVLLKPVLNAAKLRLKAQKMRPPPVHRDGIVQFWSNELRRLGLNDLSLPLIKLR